jgi:hypothetical protein
LHAKFFRALTRNLAKPRRPREDRVGTSFKPLDSRDPFSVNIYDRHNVQYWCERFACTTSELRDAVQEVGTCAVALKHYITNLQTLALPKPARVGVERRSSIEAHTAGASDLSSADQA